MSKVLVKKSGPVDAVVSVPGSKSATNRALILASLAEGESELIRASMSDDSEILVRALEQTGVEIVPLSKGSGYRVSGQGGRLRVADTGFNAGNAGTALRFLASYLCLADKPCELDGDERMRERPIQGLVDALKGLGAGVRCVRNNGCPPVAIEGRGLNGGTVEVDGSTSSQFVSSLLMVAPHARDHVYINVNSPAVSRNYIDLTCAMMKEFGVEVTRCDYDFFSVRAGQRYRARSVEIPADMAGANYFFALAAVTGGRVRVPGVHRDASGVESGFLDILEEMGCTVCDETEGVEVFGGRLLGVDVDMGSMPDSVQTLACMALFAEGPTRIRNVANLRLKETDRLQALANELTKLGARVEIHPEGLTVFPGSLHPAEIETYCDHRMAMSFAVAGAGIGGVAIKDPACVRKSFPDFWERLRHAGVDSVRES